ncbi:unnamed protein product [Strongylus vulgaris]|uniref:Uncharacterized protein n=1 Tax=Strongylus vulgaris TaxID=40348 RepID=A0A3P7LX17_STRVU|nr:unnamed protein product [Strongylus vulgaris]
MEEGDEDELANRQIEIENELIKKMKELKVEINAEQVAICVSDMIAAMSIHAKNYERVRASSPPRHDFSEDGPLIELPWSDEGEIGDDEILESEDVEVFDWSEDIFPDDDNAVVGEKRPLDVLDILDLPLKRRAVEKDGFIEQKPMETTPPPLQLRSCLRYHEEVSKYVLP